MADDNVLGKLFNDVVEAGVEAGKKVASEGLDEATEAAKKALGVNPAPEAPATDPPAADPPATDPEAPASPEGGEETEEEKKKRLEEEAAKKKKEEEEAAKKKKEEEEAEAKKKAEEEAAKKKKEEEEAAKKKKEEEEAAKKKKEEEEKEKDSQKSQFVSAPPSGKQTAEEMEALSNIKVDTAFANSAFDTLGGLSFDKLIGEPLRAAVKAQRDMAKEALNYIKKETIVSGKEGVDPQLAYVTLNFVKDGKMTRMRIPLLTLIPYPSLSIESLTYKFTASIDASSNVTLAVNADTASLAKAGNGGAAATGGGAASKTDTKNATGAAAQKASNAPSVSATYSSKPGSSATRDSRYSVETTIDMTVTAGMTAPPAGITKILEILDTSAEVVNTNGELVLSSTELTLSNGHALLSASYRDGTGTYRRDQIVCSVYDGGTVPKCLTNGDEVLFLFSEKGLYLIKAGEFQRFVFVS